MEYDPNEKKTPRWQDPAYLDAYMKAPREPEPSQEWMAPPKEPTILKPYRPPAPKPTPPPKPAARPAPKPAPPAPKSAPLQIQGEPGTILLSCVECTSPVRRLDIHQVAEAVLRGAPALPGRCQLCGAAFSPESQDRLRRFIYEHARSGNRADVRFALYPVGWMRVR
jgi:hypothetical protein